MRIAAVAAASLFSLTAFGQEPVLETGTYSGTYQGAGSNTRITITLNVQSVTDGLVKGTARRNTSNMRGATPACDGEYPVQGTFKDGQLAVRETAKGGKTGDCGIGVRAKLQGNKLVGKSGPNDVELSK
jgi:hypothetical protein